MENNIEKIILSSLKGKEKVPKLLPNVILKTINDNCFKEKKQNNINKINFKDVFYKFAIGACASFFIATGGVLAKEVISSVFNLSKISYGEEQLQIAIEEGYIQINDTNNYIVSENGILYKFNHILLNDINLIFSLDFIIDEKIEDYQGMSITGLKILDENKKQIYIDSEDQNIRFNNMATSMEFHTIEKKENILKEAIVLTSPKFEQMKKVSITFDSITLYNIVDGKVTTKVIGGNYNIEIDLNDTFEDRETVNYNVQNNYDIISIDEVKLTNTGLGIIINSTDFEGMGYKVKLLDNKGVEIYSNLNEISNYNDFKTYFVWLDVAENFNEYSKYKIEIIDIQNQSYIFEISNRVENK